MCETASRWGCTIADLAGWATEGKLQIVTGIPLALCGTEKMSGIIIVPPMDMLPLFRLSGTGPTVIKLQRMKAEQSLNWSYVTEPVEGIDVSIADLLISGQELLRFEDEYDLLRRIGGGAGALSPYTGALSPYNWEGMSVFLTKHIHEHGLPATQAELISTLQDWFAEEAVGGEIPDESTIRRRLRPFWRALRGQS